MQNKLIVIPLLLLAAMFSTASAQTEKITVCHRTESETNPFVMINISINGWNDGHINHVDDFLPVEGAIDCSIEVPPQL
jgi:hypothetical protein